MRVFLVMLLFTLLLHFSAAAVAACCGHEEALQGPRATHHQKASGSAVGDLKMWQLAAMV